MTYIVGIDYEGMNSIISDIRQTEIGIGQPKGENTALKTGLLFPGCIFGRVGNLDNSREFIKLAKKSLTQINTPNGFWSEFNDFAEKYEYPKSQNDHFQILISTRHLGYPKFYILDSIEGIKETEDRIITLGSGKDQLDEILFKNFDNRINMISEIPEIQPWKQELAPYLFCTWLNEMILSFEKIKLESFGVGGPFHFIFQVSQSEHYQKPAMYIYLDIDKNNKKIYYWKNRIAYVKNWLIVDTLIPPHQLHDYPEGKQERKSLLDEASLPPKETGEWDGEVLEKELNESLEKELSTQPLYFFCGLGFSNPQYRTAFLSHVTTEGDYIITNEGILSEDWSKKIIEHVSEF